jgi:hypothetical protein
LKRAFAPLPAYLAKLQPGMLLALIGLASKPNGPAPEKVNVPAFGSVSKFWVYVPPE